MELYSHNTYKEVLKASIEAKRDVAASARLTFQGMAEHCRIQKTYLSKVLNRDGHLSEDQLYLATGYLGLDADEKDFTLLLHSFERSEVPARKKELQVRIDAIRTAKLKTEANLKVEAPRIMELDLTEYYLDPLFQVIHMCLTLRRFQQEPEAIAAGLGLKPASLANYLRGLERMKIAELTLLRGRIVRAQVLRDNLHLPDDSILHSAYAGRMRLKGLERMDQLTSDEAYRFSVIFSTNARVRQKIHSSFIEWLKSTQKAVQGSREEDVYQMNFDLFNWT